ncbi:FAD-dependent pyridine nucleotide-disulfide oxidoreductase family protein [Syntrophotalea carbinolica DSM 2380]|uniref:FAD-dependent pyridine nucleotide-disulfide oxidoreductase family protein n=1 Tax=Syntrophotalea carbinolica (strain DSM 2380 / NBRC 103641 / GraBd1) TaxID=338963 RepID=Q3A8G9_SYNC1|nr:FAD-dependent oxidoreductase [Syntrophotalea carbinolica]ABA87323.1 FAD-dependent pyridine nucleotide-disulfide oxidoreductase family protein [Syntrophotalea carbinolica DSM 2380]
MKIVTVGTGMAAAEFVQQLRQGGFAGEIVMCSDEPHAPYSPCVIPYLLAGEPADNVYWKGRDFYARYQVTPRLGEKVVEIDREAGLLRTASGRIENYDRLFYAAGSRSWFPRPEWLEAEGVFGFKTLSDMQSIDRYIGEHGVQRAVVVGGGFIGVDAALALRHRGLQVSLVHCHERLLERMTDADGGRFATDKLQQRSGIAFYMQSEVEALDCNGGQLQRVWLQNGTALETQLLIVATGFVPNSALLSGREEGIAVGDDLLADPRILVAGDVAVTRHAIDGPDGLYATAPNAIAQARVAAANILGGVERYAGSLNANVLRKHIDFPVVSAGRFEGESVTFSNDRLFRRVYLCDDRINGYILVGDTRLAGYIYDLYVSRQPVADKIQGILADIRGESYYRSLMGLAPVAPAC